MTTSLEDELAMLVAAERERPDAGVEAAERVLAGIRARLDGATPPASVPADTPWGVLSLVGGLVVAGLVVGVWAASRPPEPARFDSVPAPALAVVAEQPMLPDLHEELKPEPDAAPAPAVARSKRENAGTVADELALIERARSSLGRGQASSALRTLKTHRRQFPKGAFLEEAAALRASALCKSGKAAAAQKASASFLRRYPNSVHESRVMACQAD